MTISPEKVLLCWSSGKDAALALSELLGAPQWEVTGLLSTVTESHGRVSMHGVRRTLLEAQAAATGLPLTLVRIPQDASNEDYERRMAEALGRHKDDGVRKVAFGDVFLQDVRDHRERNLARMDLQAVFPLWRRSTAELAERFVSDGYRAVITCVDTRQLPGRFAGREFGAGLLRDLPPGVDPCGENGEFHTFVYAGPVFGRPLRVRLGRRVLRDGRFQFCDVLAAP